MLAYFLRRMLLLLPILFAVSSVVFFFVHLIPGDPVDLILGEQALSADRELLRKALHLDLPLVQQYIHFYKNLFHGDLGVSLFEKKPVFQMIMGRYPATLSLALCSMAIAMSLSVVIGVIAAVKRGSLWDQGAMLLGLLGISVPTFCLGPVLVLFFSVKLDWLPISGRSSFASFILPSLTLGSAMAAMLVRMTRSSMLEVLKEDYLRTARAKGVSEFKTVVKHAFRVAMNPVLTIVGLQFGALLAGAVVTEKIFAWPGVGTLMMQAIERRDYPVLQGCILFVAVTYSFVNLLTDLIQARLDPRIRLH